MILPASRHITRCENRITACMMCSIMMIGDPGLVQLEQDRRGSRRPPTDESPAIASSEISSRGRAAIARASSSLRSSTWVSRLDSVSALSARPMLPEDLHRLAAGVGGVQRAAVDHVLERDDQVLHHRHARERPRQLEAARDAAARALIGGQPGDLSPSNAIEPPSFRSEPEMQLMSVVLPEPFGPIRPKRSPRAISTLTSDSAVKPPKCFGARDAHPAAASSLRFRAPQLPQRGRRSRPARRRRTPRAARRRRAR